MLILISYLEFLFHGCRIFLQIRSFPPAVRRLSQLPRRRHAPLLHVLSPRFSSPERDRRFHRRGTPARQRSLGASRTNRAIEDLNRRFLRELREFRVVLRGTREDHGLQEDFRSGGFAGLLQSSGVGREVPNWEIRSSVRKI